MQLRIASATVALGLLAAGCPASKSSQSGESAEPFATGEISFYADSLAGNKTASGEPYDPKAMTCAHRKLPFGTELRIDLVKTKTSATCTVNDRGPYAKHRILDVSKAVAEELEMVKAGAAQAELTILSRPEPKKK